MWILILTLLTQEAATVSSTPGFATEAACMAAGTDWKSAAEGMRRHVQASFVCAKPTN